MGNWNRGQQADWQRGRNKRLRFSVHFDADSEEFNQLLQTGFLHLAGQGHFHPPPPPCQTSITASSQHCWHSCGTTCVYAT
jgi:hypothetical protein